MPVRTTWARKSRENLVARGPLVLQLRQMHLHLGANRNSRGVAAVVRHKNALDRQISAEKGGVFGGKG